MNGKKAGPVKPFVETAERLNRVEALNQAVRLRKADESVADVVKNAQAYFDFLQGAA